ncbi:MAG: NAD(P)H-hydrate dehydratase [bacterium]|nr:NAD(P)H-hydrate dehydratase [bacterium]
MMRPVLTAEQSRHQDAQAADDPCVLLDRAGWAVARQAVAMDVGYGSQVAVLAGPGNNGGDGYVAAHYLAARGVSVDVYPLASPRTDPAQWAHELVRQAGVPIRDREENRPADLVIDALFGGGFRGTLPNLSNRATPMDGSPAPWLAVDVPSGLDATTGEAASGTMPARATVTFHGYRVGHLVGSGPDLCGRIVVADIGLPDIEPEMWLCEESDAPLPVRSRTAHKWSSGSVLVIGGSDGLDGAATLTARSALRAGAGAVMIACPPTVEDRVRAPEIMTRAVGSGRSLTIDDLPPVLELVQRFDLAVIGPGLGTSPDLSGFVNRFLQDWPGPVVADADALNALDGPAGLIRNGETVITPHTGEFQRLTGWPGSYEAASRLAHETGVTVLLKGSPTFVIGEERWVVDTGGPELATIGTGDVLAGMIGAFWAARGGSGTQAARSAAYWHGVAGAELQANRTVTADRLVEQVAITTRR